MAYLGNFRFFNIAKSKFLCCIWNRAYVFCINKQPNRVSTHLLFSLLWWGKHTLSHDVFWMKYYILQHSLYMYWIEKVSRGWDLCPPSTIPHQEGNPRGYAFCSLKVILRGTLHTTDKPSTPYKQDCEPIITPQMAMCSQGFRAGTLATRLHYDC